MSVAAHSNRKLKREAGTPLHRQVFMVLKDQIIRGIYPSNSTIPKEDELERIFGVSRITVRRAVADLEQLGLVEKQPGKGTFVTERAAPHHSGPTLSLLESLSTQARDTNVEVLSVEVVSVPAYIALQLQLVAGQKAVHASRLRRLNGVPVMVTEAWIPEKLGKNVTAKKLKKEALFQILMRDGVSFSRAVQEVTALAADPYLADLLQTAVGSPLLRMSRLIYDHSGAPVQHTTVTVSPERTRLLMDIQSEAINTFTAGHFSHDLISDIPDTSEGR